MKVVVTGANGFLGAWLTRRLLAEGHEVSALIRKNSDLSELENAKPKYVYGDVTDKNSLREAFKNQDIVFHLAGVVAYRASDRPLMDRVNVEGTRYVVDICEELKIPQLLHMSSVVAVGASFTPQAMTEASAYNIKHLNLGYFETKRLAEEIVVKAANEKRINAVCVNPGTIYGFGDAKKGSRKTQVKVARGEFPFYTAGGINVVAAEDIIEGTLLAVKKGKNGERYLLTNENMKIKDLFIKIAGFAGVKAPKIYMPTWALQTIGISGDLLEKVGVNIGVSQENAYTATMFHWFDSSKARNELGFSPSSADRAIENSVRWMKDNGYLK
ncbi:NAD-dependent epimerase/dehydratase family protein [bacterium]|nr:NAD-dependent epimerase/dehydratase family protein [bacterium]